MMPMWSFELEGGPRRVNHAAVAIGDRIFSFGGYCTGDDFTIVKPIDIHIFNTASLQWREVQCHPGVRKDDIPYQRYGHSAVGLDHCVYLWGGRNDKNGSSNTLYSFNTVNGMWHTPKVSGMVPYGRDGHTATLYQHKMYIFGGYDEEMDRFCNDVNQLDLDTFVWTHVRTIGGEAPARWRDFHTAAMLGPLMYVFGGRSDQGGDIFTYNEIYYNEVTVFDVRTREWSRPRVYGPRPIGRRSHSTFIYAGELYIFGGFNSIHKKHFNTIHAFNPVTCQWREVSVSGVDGPCARRRQCCCLIGSRVFVFGGTGDEKWQFLAAMVCALYGDNDWFTGLSLSGGTGPGLVETEPSQDDMTVDLDIDDHNLIDFSDLHILDFNPTLKTLCMMTVLSHKLDTANLPSDIRKELSVMSSKPRTENPNG